MREIVVCGESLVDVVETAQAATGPQSAVPRGPRLPALQPALGGGPFNVAITLGRLGSAVSLCSAVSTEAYGESVIAALDAAGVGTRLIQRRPEPTSLALATLDDAGSARYSFYVEGTADRLVADPGELAPTVAAVCFGTLSLVLEPGATVYERMLRREHARGRLVALDPNIRPMVIADADAYRRRFRSWLPHVHLLKLSDDDAEWLGRGESGSGVADWLAAGVTAVVITGGAAGISVHTRDVATRVPAPHVDVADTIGAGDSVMGGLLRHLDTTGALTPDGLARMDETQWNRAAAFAGKVAAITVSRPGADPPWAGEVGND